MTISHEDFLFTLETARMDMAMIMVMPFFEIVKYVRDLEQRKRKAGRQWYVSR